MHEADFDFRQRFGELGGGVFGGLRRHFVGFFDERADPVHLPAFAAGRGDARDDFAATFFGNDDRLDRRATGRQLVDHGDVEVGVLRHGQRSRDRRGGHDDLMRRAAFLAALLLQSQALLHAEAVLLVDDDERELREVDAFLKQRMGADDDPHFAGRDSFERALATLAGCEPETSATGRCNG